MLLEFLPEQELLQELLPVQESLQVPQGQLQA